MTEENAKLWSMETSGGDAVPLAGIEIEGEAEGLFLRTVIRQTYENRSKQTIEAVYTFPVSLQAAVTRFAAVIGGKRLVARSLPKREAEETYEKAIAEGDAPLMIEWAADGLCTASIGNLKAGEKAVIEITALEPLHWIAGTVRITLPSVIAQRYGESSLLPHQKTETSLLAEYPVKASYVFRGELARASSFSSPSHLLRVRPAKDGAARVEILKAFADRDLALVLTGVPPLSGGAWEKTEEGYAVAAAFTPKAGSEAKAPLQLKVLVDCSGSMEGVSIQKAREALAALSEILGPEDRVTLTRFGSDFEHIVAAPAACTESFMRRDWIPAVRGIEADLGGTELEEALRSVLKLGSGRSDVLIVTDGEVWDMENLKAAARESDARLFVLGVGAAPAEDALRPLAQLSGGAYEAVLPAEDMAGPVSRMARRMRLPKSERPEAAWNAPAARWQQPLPASVFPGESLTVFAFMKELPKTAPVLTLGGGEGTAGSAFRWSEAECPGLAKLAAQAMLADGVPEEKKEETARRFGLLSPWTNLILVSERAESEKPADEPVLVRVPQMAAAGQGFVLQSPSLPNCVDEGLSMSADILLQARVSPVSAPFSEAAADYLLTGSAEAMNELDFPRAIFEAAKQLCRLAGLKKVHHKAVLVCLLLIAERFPEAPLSFSVRQAFASPKVRERLVPLASELGRLFPPEHEAWAETVMTWAG